MEWRGADALLLNEYFENKEKLFKLKKEKEYLNYRDIKDNSKLME